LPFGKKILQVIFKTWAGWQKLNSKKMKYSNKEHDFTIIPHYTKKFPFFEKLLICLKSEVKYPAKLPLRSFKGKDELYNKRRCKTIDEVGILNVNNLKA